MKNKIVAILSTAARLVIVNTILVTAASARSIGSDAFESRPYMSGFYPTSGTGNNAGATRQSGEPDHSPFAEENASLWWKWKAPENGLVRIDASGEASGSRVTLAVYIGTNISTLERVRISQGNYSSGLASFLAIKGQEYQIAVDSVGGRTKINLTLYQDISPVTPPGVVGANAFANRRSLGGENAGGVTCNYQYSTESGEPDAGLGTNNIGATAWWSWTAPKSGSTKIIVKADVARAVVSVFRGSSFGSMSRVVSGIELSSNPDNETKVVFNAVAGTTYQVVVDTLDGQANIDLNLSMSEALGYSYINLSGNLNFGNVNVGSSSTRILTIANNGNKSLAVSGLSLPTGFSGNFSGSIEAGGRRDVTITFRPASTRAYSGTITVNSDRTSGTSTISCSGTGIDDSGKPNLAPYRPVGWSDIIVISKDVGATRDDEELTSADTLYLNWGMINNGDVLAKLPSKVSIYINDILYAKRDMARPLMAGYYRRTINQQMTQFAPGWYDIKIVVDSDNNIDELNESDNTYRRYFYVKKAEAVVSDYDGDKISDLAVFNPANGAWYIGDAGDRVITWKNRWGWSTAKPVLGDYDGDGVFDLAVYDTVSSAWYVKSIAKDLLAWETNWGSRNSRPVPGDYNGDGKWDLAVYDTRSGNWYTRNLVGDAFSAGGAWGWPGALPVSGDYDGDGRFDKAVFDTKGGYWYIQSISDDVIAWKVDWGWSTAMPVPGDYNGDGAYDLAVYDTANGKWYIRTLDGEILAWGFPFGATGFKPISGDFDGDGAFDLAVVNEQTGVWFISTLDEKVIAFGKQWGWPSATYPTL